MEELIKNSLKLIDGKIHRMDGSPAKLHKNNRGYLMVCAGGSFIQAHRIAFFLSNGYMPDEVDHIDGDSFNNEESNLRASNRSLNMANQGLRDDSAVKYKGVDYHAPTGKFRARIKRKHIGLYDCPIDAAVAYDDAAIKAFGCHAKTNKDLGLI